MFCFYGSEILPNAQPAGQLPFIDQPENRVRDIACSKKCNYLLYTNGNLVITGNVLNGEANIKPHKIPFLGTPGRPILEVIPDQTHALLYY